MNSSYKTLNKIQTHVITWGDPFNSKGQDVIVCVTGNPGIPDFYIEFASELHMLTKLPVCVIGHAGHEEVPDKSSNILENQENLFNLEGQLLHKLDLINNHLDKDSKLHLIGHSIGAWLLLELLHRNKFLLKRVLSVNLLFPTIQKMSDSKNGKYLNSIVRNLHMVFLLLFTLLHLLPISVRLFLINAYLKFNSISQTYADAIVKYLNPRVAEKVLYLAYDEMDSVKELNSDALKNVKHLTNVIYSNKDDWAPVHYMDDLKVYTPEMHLKEVDIGHTFVLKSSEKVAEMVSQFILGKLIQ